MIQRRRSGRFCGSFGSPIYRVGMRTADEGVVRYGDNWRDEEMTRPFGLRCESRDGYMLEVGGEAIHYMYEDNMDVVVCTARSSLPRWNLLENPSYCPSAVPSESPLHSTRRSIHGSSAAVRFPTVPICMEETADPTVTAPSAVMLETDGP